MFDSRKSQLTMIIIVGLLLLVVFYFLFSLRNELAPDSKANSNLVYELESGLIKNHVSSCIERVTSDAIEKLGANGGVIYDFEGGTIPYNASMLGKNHLDYTVGARTFYVQHGLKENSYCPQLSYAHPDYPYAGKGLNEVNALYLASDECAYGNAASDFDGVLGEVTLEKLCPFNTDSSCPVFAKGTVPGLTVKNQIEDYLKSKLDLCVNLSYFGDEFDAQIMLEGNSTTRVSVRENDVQVSVSYPIRITYKDAHPISKVVDYHASLNVRLGRLYYFLYDVLSKDARDLEFNMEKDALASSYYLPGFELRKVKNSCTSCSFPSKYDDVVEVSDSNSIVNGKELVLRTAVQDRMPILDFIPDEAHDLASVISVYDLNIPISAVDPDDTPVTYYFLSEGQSPGWRESPPGSSPFELQQGSSNLRFFLSSKDDLGVHNVAVLASDDSGYFDFQRFKISVTNSALIAPVNTDDCIDVCTMTPENCHAWCTLSANSCAGECFGDFAPNDPSCKACVEPLFYAATSEAHVQCNTLSEVECNNDKPDCFWVEESDTLTFSAGCKNDYDLEASQRYASIEN